MDSWLAENGSRAAAVLQTVLGHLDTAYTGAVFIGMVPVVMVLCMPALRLACVPMPHAEQWHHGLSTSTAQARFTALLLCYVLPLMHRGPSG